MENNEIINNEEVMEVTEEIVKTTSSGGFKKATTIGLAMIAGALTYKFVVIPTVTKIKNWHENRDVNDFEDDIIDGTFKNVDTEGDSEELN